MIRNLCAALMIVTFLVACAPRMAAPISTIAPTVTISARILTDAPDFARWIKEYASAYGGKINIDGAELDAKQLIDAIRQDPGKYTQTKVIGENASSYLVIHGVPLAIQDVVGAAWREIGYKDLKIPGTRPLIGASVAIWTDDFDNDPRFKEIFAKNFEIAATDGTLSDYELMSKIPERKITSEEAIQYYDWANIDKLSDFLEENKIPLRAMHLIDGYTTDSVPSWLNQMSTSELEQYIRNHIKTVLTRDHYSEASVVNEAFWGNGMPGNNFWYSRFGDKYIEIAFDTARENSPDTKLILNDNIVYGPRGQNSPDGQWTNSVLNEESLAILNWVTKEKNKNIPIDGIGIESHVQADDFINGDVASIIAKYQTDLVDLMKRYQKIGVDVYLTELDVNIGNLPDSWTDFQKQELKAKIYVAMFESCLLSDNCESVTTWGFSDTASWMLTDAYPYGVGKSPLPMDENYQPAMSNYEIKKVLYANLQ